jgi:PAS domain-containing protein
MFEHNQVMSTRKQFIKEGYYAGECGGRWQETYKNPVFNEQGEVIGSTGIRRDVSQQRILENELLEQRKLLKSLIDAVPDLIFYKDLNGAYLGCNHSFAHNFIGLTEEEIAGKSDFELVKDLSWPVFLYRRTRRFCGQVSRV